MRLSKEVKIAVIAIIVLLITIWGYSFLKGKNILKPKQVYYVMFDRVDGLIESGIVSYKGYKVGNIEEIRYDTEKSGKFILRIALEEKIHIPLNSVVKIKSTSPIVASNELELIFSDTTAFHHPGDTLISEPIKGISEILEPLEDKFISAVNGIDSLVSSLNQILTADTRKNIRNSLASLDESLASLKAALGPKGSITGTFNNLESVTTAIESKKPQITSGIDHLANITAALDSANLKRALSDLDSTLGSLHAILTKIDESQGTMGKFINDSALYAHLDSTTSHLNELMIDLKKHPKRYVHFSVFGKKDR
jgi:phospholipid/cholesterol/gamma-HCH transport system substrate-binding protein